MMVLTNSEETRTASTLLLAHPTSPPKWLRAYVCVRCVGYLQGFSGEIITANAERRGG